MIEMPGGLLDVEIDIGQDAVLCERHTVSYLWY